MTALTKSRRRTEASLANAPRASPGAWGVGALYRRIQHAVPGVAASDGWPPAKTVAPVVSTETRDQAIERIRMQALRGYRAPEDMPMDQVVRDREALVERALAEAGFLEVKPR